MFRKLIALTLVFGFLAACTAPQQKKSDEMAQSGRWYSAFLALEKYMTKPDSDPFKNFVEKANADPNFEASMVAEFAAVAQKQIHSPVLTQSEKAKYVAVLDKTLDALGQFDVVSNQSLGRMVETFDSALANAYKNNNLVLGLHEAPTRARQLAVSMVQQPQIAFSRSWTAAENGDDEALSKLLQIGRDVAKQGAPHIEQMTLEKLQTARLPFPAWQNHIVRFHPELANARMAALETRLFAEFDFQNRLLGYQTRDKLSALAPDIRFVEKAEDAEGILIIRELMFQTNGPNVNQQRQVLGAKHFNSWIKSSYPNISMVVWDEVTTEMSGQWAIQLELQKPDGGRISERMTRGEKTEKAIQCSDPGYIGFGDERPRGWPAAKLEERCKNEDVPVTNQDYFQDLAIADTLNNALSLLGSLRKVVDPNVKTGDPVADNSWRQPSPF